MPFYKFDKSDVYRNVIKTYPQSTFFIYRNTIYYNEQHEIAGKFASNVRNIPSGHISLYELNIDRSSGNTIYPFITKEGTRSTFRTVSTSDFNNNLQFGDQITGSYPLSASISRHYYSEGDLPTGSYIEALRNSFDEYIILSQHYQYSSSWGDKSQQEISMVDIPSIFYGSSVRRGSVKLDFYISGTHVATLRDINRNGELIQSEPVGSNGSGSVAGVVLYNEGAIVLTGSWDISDGTHTESYEGSPVSPKWINFGAMRSTLTLSSFNLSFEGVYCVPTLTMMAHAKKGELNFSNNPTFMSYSSSDPVMHTSSVEFIEDTQRSIKNIVSSSYYQHTASFENTTFISKIGIFDDDKNLIAIAKLANPVKKTEQRGFSIKIKVDL
jgi:hypothetical protein